MTKSGHAVFALILSLVLSALTLVLMLFALQPAAKGDSSAMALSEASSDQQMAITTILADDYAQQSSQGGLIYQDLESGDPNDMGWGEGCSVTVSTELTHSGQYSWQWWWDSGTEKRTVITSTVTDLLCDKNDRLVFWIYSLAAGDGAEQSHTVSFTQDYTVSVTFYDDDQYSDPNGFEVWTRQRARYGQWTKLAVLFDQLPDDFNLRAVDKIAFKMYWPGVYYLDDIQAIREDRVYQSFEPSKFGGITDTDYYGWSWFYPTSTVGLSEEGEPVYEGEHSWKLVVGQHWDGTAIKSERAYYSPTVDGTQSIWNVDLNHEYNDHLILWVYALPENRLDNSLVVQFYDRGAHSSYTNCVSYWTDKTPAVYGKWSQLRVSFAELITRHPDLDLNHIEKIQVQADWPGTYYIDKIEAVGSMPEWDNSLLRDGVLKWSTGRPLDQYRLQENTVTGDLRDGNWVDVYTGTGTPYTIPHISRVWYRVRAEDVISGVNEVPFVSTWSDPLEYNPPTVLIDKSTLMISQTLTWTQLAHATAYTVESASSFNGPWTPIYTGAYPTAPLSASENTWYRVRAGTGTEESDWSPPQWKPNPINQDILRTYGTTIRKGPTDEIGDVVVLRGVNLGNYLLIEPWLSGWGPGNITSTETVTETDYYTIRSVLEARLGADSRDALLQTYRDSYLTDADFDILMRMGVNLVRLPIYYGELQDDDGELIPGSFEKLDRIVNACADRGIYVLLDLHGAPGAQSEECCTGRCDYNRLFQGTEPEQALFQTRTVELWEAIAERYKDNTMVMGYDLLNEPMGATDLMQLWDFYDRLYDAIRAKDSDHIIVMEAIWDLDTLPHPSEYGWENVVYQLHTYCSWCEDENESYANRVEAHKRFIDNKIALVQRRQVGCRYQVPILIGEFHAYDSREVWEYYLEHFNDQGWSWTIWTYKMAIPNSTWGLLTDRYYDPEEVPIFWYEDPITLEAKLSEQFSTLTRYMPNESLVGIVESYVNEPYALSAQNRFQAEHYDASWGVNAYTTPVGHIGSLNTGDWVRYDAIEFTEDLDTFVANLAVPDTHAGGRIEIRLDDRDTGTVIGTMTVAKTGYDWWTFVEQRTPISPVTGVHDVYLTFTGDGVANIDWFAFKGNYEPYALSALNTFQAECYDGCYRVDRTEYYIGSLDTGDWVRYDAVEFTDDLNTFVANLAVDDAFAGKQIVVRLDHQITGTVVGTLTVAGTVGWWNFDEQRAPISPITGLHDVYLTFAGGSGVANIDWFTFEAALYLPVILKNYPP